MSGQVIHERCLNCAAPLMGKYCAMCGQKDQSDRPELHHFIPDAIEFRHRLLGNASKTMFLMLPLFALVVQIGFRTAKRVYLEQLILALHIHSLAFLLFAAAALISSEGDTSFRFVSDLLLLLGIPTYGLLTFKRVFGLSWFSTVVRAVGGFAYSIIFIVTEIGLVAATLSSL
jgi:hypothetical protein